MQISGSTGAGAGGGGASAELPDFMPLRWFLGNGRDGAVNFDGVNTYPAFATKVGNVYTLTEAPWATSITVAAGVTVETTGYFLIATGAVINNGTISSTSGTPASGFNAGNVLSRTITTVVPCRLGNNGGAGGATAAGSAGQATGGGLGGAGGAGGAAGANAGGVPGGRNTTYANDILEGGYSQTPQYRVQYWAEARYFNNFSGGVGGGGGGSVSSGARGGGGGYGGGLVIINAASFVNNGVVGVQGSPGAAAPGANAGGGGGGGGGWVITNTLAAVVGSGTYNVAGGAGGAGNGTGLAGSAGAAGTVTNNVWPA